MASAEVVTTSIKLHLGALEVDVAFSLTAPWTCLFGASGSGKTSILRVLAGFVRPQLGEVTVFGRVMSDCASGMWVPPYARPVKTAAQQAWLFPGTVMANVRYGARQVEQQRCMEVLDLLRLTRRKDSAASSLSGGERQRASLARAVVAAAYAAEQPQFLLLDEPFSGMDLVLRNEVAVDMQGWLAGRGIPVLSVTHDASEALLLDAEVIRLSEGRITVQGRGAEVLAQERATLQRILA